MSGLGEATAVANQADSESAVRAISSTNSTVVSKPLVVRTAPVSRADIKEYTTRAGDSVSKIAAKFGVTSDSVRWSNDLTGNIVTVGQKLVIPPQNGIVYTVESGDTPESLARKFNASKDKIVAFNDAEIRGLKKGERIFIPGGTKSEISATTQYVSTPVTTAVSYPWGSAPVYGYNGYDYGYCTWYVASRISVPSNWGNANTWDNLAPLSGWTVSGSPRVGAVAQTDRGAEGHVAIVEAVSPDGLRIKYSDMNGIAGWGRVGYSGWVSAGRFEHYIYH
jgi:surface antigen